MPSDFFKDFALLQEFGVLRTQAADLRLKFLTPRRRFCPEGDEVAGSRSARAQR